MKFLLAMVAMVLGGGCIEEAERFPVDVHTSSDASADTHVDVDPETCGKCIEAWTTVAFQDEGGIYSCIEYTQTGVLCCKAKGDTGCPTETSGVAWAACSDIDTGVCRDDDAITPTTQVVALCVRPATGCEWAEPVR